MQIALQFFGELILLFIISKVLIGQLSRLIFKITGNKKLTIYVLAFLFLPGTAVHEMAHVFMAAILQVPVGDIDLMPKVEEDRIKLGSVPIAEPDPFRMFAIGAAPFFVGIALIVFIFAIFTKFGLLGPWWSYLVCGYIAFEIGNTMFSSKRDMEGAAELLGVAVLFLGVLYFLGVRISVESSGFLASQFNPVLELGSKFLLAPIAIDAAIILIAALINRGRR